MCFGTCGQMLIARGAVDRYVAMTRATQQLVFLDGEGTLNR